MLRSLDALGGLWWKEVVLMDGPTSSWCTPVLELRLSHACTNHAVLPGEWAELCKRCVEAATRRDEGILYGSTIVRRYHCLLSTRLQLCKKQTTLFGHSKDFTF